MQASIVGSMKKSSNFNLKVAVRCSPNGGNEISANSTNIVYVENNSVFGNIKENENVKMIDSVFGLGPETTQEQLYNELGRPIVIQALAGVNGTLFTYGETGAGKTHSLMGSKEDKGIIPRLCEDIFRRISEKLSDEGTDNCTTKILEIFVTASYLEIYDEKIQDLFVTEKKNLQMNDMLSRVACVEGLSQHVCVE